MIGPTSAKARAVVKKVRRAKAVNCMFWIGREGLLWRVELP